MAGIAEERSWNASVAGHLQPSNSWKLICSESKSTMTPHFRPCLIAELDGKTLVLYSQKQKQKRSTVIGSQDRGSNNTQQHFILYLYATAGAGPDSREAHSLDKVNFLLTPLGASNAR